MLFLNYFANRKQIFKLVLLLVAGCIFLASIWYSNMLVKKIADEERNKAILWADAIQKKASLVKYTETFFEQLKVEEKKKVQIWAAAIRRLINADYTEDISFYSEVVAKNTTIPVILTDDNDNIYSAMNVDFNVKKVRKLKGKIKEEFSQHEPIVYSYGKSKNYLYYKESKIFSELRNVLDDLIKSFMSEVVINSASVPVIITDSLKKNVIVYGNIDSSKINDKANLGVLLYRMSKQNTPIEISFINTGKSYIFYEDSDVLKKLRYYPFVQFMIVSIFIILAYFGFNASRRAEQNSVWLGLAKETAHQLGTPMSSLIAIAELLKLKDIDETLVVELEKDINRLNNITERFSKIGSPPKLANMNIIEVTENAVNYMRDRTSKNISMEVINQIGGDVKVPLNANLFEWVIENLCKNAVDAMAGNGKVTITISDDTDHIHIDVSDTGKGMSKSMFFMIFTPGFTTKKRGWGLGLSLSKRIIENYHKGRIFVKNSTINKGTTFRIIIQK